MSIVYLECNTKEKNEDTNLKKKIRLDKKIHLKEYEQSLANRGKIVK